MIYNKISILGCGWLGFPLATRLLSYFPGLRIKGSTTTSDKLDGFKAAGIEGYLFSLDPTFNGKSAGTFFDADCLIIAIPPKLSKFEPSYYPRQLQTITELPEFSAAKNIIFVSSTSVYPELNRLITEEEVQRPEQSMSPSLVEGENLMQKLRPDKTVTILRMGGLMGFDRIPGKYVSGQKNMLTGTIPVNYIHRDDAIGIIIRILEDGLVNETFNAVAPLHPTRREVYESSCHAFHWESPTFASPANPIDFKIISADKLSKFYSYNFLFPDPLAFHYAL